MAGVDHLDPVGAVGLARALGLELRETRHARRAEEVLVCPVEVAQGLLERDGVGLPEPGGLGVGLPAGEHLVDLEDGGDPAAGITGLPAEGEGAVVDEAAAAERPRDRLALRGVWVYAVFVAQFHK